MTNRNRQVTALEAKTRLGRLLDRVQSGEELVITRHGEPIARLVPIGERVVSDHKRALAIFAQVREEMRQRGKKIAHNEIREWINEGRR